MRVLTGTAGLSGSRFPAGQLSDWITVREAAQILGVHPSAIPKMIRRGDLSMRRWRTLGDTAGVMAAVIGSGPIFGAVADRF